MKKVGVVILHYKGIKDTRECLQSVFKADSKGLDIKVFLVNNSPTFLSFRGVSHNARRRGNLKRLPRSPDVHRDPLAMTETNNKITLINNKQNLGFAAGNNLGIKKALKWKADYIILLNNDTRVSKKLFVDLVKEAEKNKKIGLLSPKIYFEKGYEFHKKRYKKNELGKVIWYAGGQIDWNNVYGKHRGVDRVDKGQYKKHEETEFAAGCCLLIKPFVFERIGFLNEDYFMYWEDADFSMRTRSAGIKVCYTGKAHLWHKNAGGSGVGSSLHDYFLTRNRMLFGFRYAPFRTKLSLVRESIKKLFAGREWERIGVRDFFLQKLGKGSYKS